MLVCDVYGFETSFGGGSPFGLGFEKHDVCWDRLGDRSGIYVYVYWEGLLVLEGISFSSSFSAFKGTDRMW